MFFVRDVPTISFREFDFEAEVRKSPERVTRWILRRGFWRRRIADDSGTRAAYIDFAITIKSIAFLPNLDIDQLSQKLANKRPAMPGTVFAMIIAFCVSSWHCPGVMSS